MDMSLRWLNSFLEPGGVTAEEADRLLTQAGFPIEGIAEAPHNDTLLDVEVTSNRGDCLSHAGCAREVAAMSGTQRLVLPEAASRPATTKHGNPVSDHLKLVNEVPDDCPRFVARVIRGCKVGPSPAWLRELLEAAGQRSINNAVDVTNYVTLGLGNPCHVFDLARLSGPELRIRRARAGEELITLDDRRCKLTPEDIVVADAERAQSLAGVKGGKPAETTEATTDIVLEMATWAPAVVRRVSRRLDIRTDASHRFERIVPAGTIDESIDIATRLLCDLTGGVACGGQLDEGPGDLPRQPITLRPERVRVLLGSEQEDAAALAPLLARHGIQSEQRGDALVSRPPVHRPDLTREIDLIEEIARTRGLDVIRVADRLAVAARPPQATEVARRLLGETLAGLGYFEAITFSFVTPDEADAWLPKGARLLHVDEKRRPENNALRPAVTPSLLAVRRRNQNAGVDHPGGVRLFETAAVFSESAARPGETNERRVLSLLVDAVPEKKKPTREDLELAVRRARGAIEAVASRLGGPAANIAIEPAHDSVAGIEADASGRVVLITAGSRTDLGWIGVVAADTQRKAELDRPAVAAEVALDPLLGLYPPAVSVQAPPAFPFTERDVSLIVSEGTAWAAIETLVASLGLEKLESTRYVTTFRGEAIGADRKSITLRLRFRDESRTLTREEVEPQVQVLVAEAKDKLSAEVRS